MGSSLFEVRTTSSSESTLVGVLRRPAGQAESLARGYPSRKEEPIVPSFQASHLRIPLIAVTLAVACSPGPADRVADTAAVAADTSRPAGGHDMAGMAMTGDADRDFLRMMSSHHRGPDRARARVDAEGGTGARRQSQDDARILDARQDRELEQMLGTPQGRPTADSDRRRR